MAFEKEIILLIAVVILIVYLFATKDNPYVPINERVTPWKSKRRVINYHGWKGPMFIEDFTNTDNSPKYNKSKEMCHRFAKNKCITPTLTSEQDWYNEYWNSTYKMTGPSDQGSLCRGPNWKKGDPGNYRQVTNNNLDPSNNLKCQARSTNKDFCHPCDKVSPKCYVHTLNKCLDEIS